MHNFPRFPVAGSIPVAGFLFTGKIKWLKLTLLILLVSMASMRKPQTILQVRPDSLNQEWLIDQVKKGAIYVCDVIEEDGFEHTGEECD